MTDTRPCPNALLDDTVKRRRGCLRLFIGMAPGVGKTYAMLSEAHQRRAAGRDVLIGWVDTHKRMETEALCRGLEVLPRRRVLRGNMVEEALDLDEILRRAPSVVVIDEMPHSNPPGSRHPKRWQDIEEILDMGIDVWSALNIQHLESLNGVVARVTGVEVRETVPDRIFDDADEVRLVDLPPDDLLARLAAGKIYLPETVERAKANYFRRSNLIALRELALRSMANRMETQIREDRLKSTRRTVEDTAFGLLLVLEAPSEKAVREGLRFARALCVPLHVVWISSGASEPPPEALATLRFAKELGATTEFLAGRFADEISRYAREHNLSTVALSNTSGFTGFLRRRALAHTAPELHVLALSSIDDHPHPSFWRRVIDGIADAFADSRGWMQSAAVTTALMLALIPLKTLLEPTNHAMIYLLGTLWCGMRYGSGPAALSAILSIFAFDLSVIEPFWSFSVSDTQFLITFVVMLVVGLVVGQLTANTQATVRRANAREHETRMLFDASQELSSALTETDALGIVSGTLARYLRVDVEFWRPDETPEDKVDREGKDNKIAPPELVRFEAVLRNVDPAVVRWTFDHNAEAGSGTNTLASTPYWYLPMHCGGETIGVAVIHFRLENGNVPAVRHSVETVVTLGAQTLHRLDAAQEARHTLVSMESERLRHSLIQSLSHDLRTPLAMMRVLAEGLRMKLSRRHFAAATEDADKLLNSTGGMERLVGNLLEMARLQNGRIELRKTWIPAEELFGTVLADMGERIKRLHIRVDVPEDPTMVYGDELLLVRVISNLLDNAVKYCPAGSTVVLSAKRRGDNMVVTVADNGPGLPEGDPQRLFDPFRRGQKEQGVTGVGLGLAICRTIARAHDAELFAMPSRLGGAAFALTLPYVPMEMPDEDFLENENAPVPQSPSDDAQPHPQETRP